jgi:class 3 adenylate cyclase/tetratricopeptide (TPR) repeat protein
MVSCAHCGESNRDGRKFCSACGGSLASGCAACGAPLEAGDRFCGACGAAVTATTQAGAAGAAAPVAERRLVSLLFADLVGFTAASAGRDAEDTRELLSRYFDTSRRLIELYGGTVEKFIGDAVMAVWGAPTATEDDAERAVRAGLDLVAAVSALGDELGVERLRARAGVLTGEAAVTIGATGEGMVAGDLVNTASRVQSAAEPGEVFVGEATRRAAEQTIVFEDAGSYPLKGKDGLTPLWRARRVVAARGGALKSHGLEAPFVGRDRELRQIKDLFHRAADERRSHLVSVTGIAGIGKSRLVWEFYKYFDGLAATVYWHRGRCLSYGEGVTYWALADMVRMRCRIAEDEPAVDALVKLGSALDEHVPDPEERAFVEPRVAQLLGLADHHVRDQRDLFAAWRLLFERLADTYPVVLAFEDLQWADASLLDFIEHLLDWSRDSPIFVIALARPELVSRRPGWGAGQRSFTSVHLDPLPAPAMEALLGGLVPGVPPQVRDGILARAEGVPLYAVETVRMLLDRGLLVADGDSYRLTGSIDALAVPETLHALIASRLDGLPADERRLVQDAAVLGKAFTTGALTSLAGPGVGVEPLLESLVRKEVLGLQADPRSPEYGQHVFLQDLVRHVAYETLARRDRRVRHLAAAAHLTHAFDGDIDEVVEVIASHYLAAQEAGPDAADAPEVRERAMTMLERAGRRSESLGAAQEASRYYEQSAELADTAAERAALLDKAGSMAGRSGDMASARRLLAEAIALYEDAGDTHVAARVVGRLGWLEAFTERRDEALAEMVRAYEVIAADEPDEDLALLAGWLALSYWYSGDLARATEFAERALDIAETHAYQKALVVALQCRAGVAVSRGHRVEAGALLDRALPLALEHDQVDEAHSIYIWLSDLCLQRDDYAAALGYLDEVLALSRRVGDRRRELGIVSERTYVLLMTGHWDEALGPGLELTRDQIDTGALLLSTLQSSVEIHVKRGELQKARNVLALFEGLAESSDTQALSGFLADRASLRLAEGRFEDALADGAAAVDVGRTFGIAAQAAKQGLVEALEAAFALGRTDTVHELLARIDAVPAGSRPPYLDAHARRFRARLDGDAGGYLAAADGFRTLGLPFWLAVTLLEHAELTADRASLDEAQSIFEELKATPWLERVAAAADARAAQPTGGLATGA